VNSLFTRLRLLWSAATRSSGFGLALIDRLYRIYLNHAKVIHFRDGRPVYSLTTPALFSKPAANFMARALYRTIQNRNLPNLMSLAVNDDCNAACEHCSFFSAVEEKGRAVLSLEEMVKGIADAQELGISVLNLVGGEPLLRDDLPALIRAVDKDISTVLLFTNGSDLEARASELRRAGLDSIFVSIDAADPARHDHFRRTPGLFERALRGVRRAKRLGFSVGFSATLTPEAWRRGELERIVELGRTVGVHEVFVFDALPTGRYKNRSDLLIQGDDDTSEARRANELWVEDMVRWAKPYNANPRYPGVTFFAYLTSHRSAGCSCGTSYFYLSPYGDVMSCDFNHAKFGNVLEEPLWRIWDRLSTLPEFRQAKWGGCKIKDSAYRELGTVSPGPSSAERSCC
jgi:MoaA/NifB/PqqE/SkfB family radical SAM enzyme